MVKSTNEHEDGSDKPYEFIEFKSLFNGIMATAHCRVYFIVDVCHSGNIANKDLSDKVDFSDEAYLNIRRNIIPERGAVLFLSNNRDVSGKVQADDTSGLDRPMFSQVLFDILNEGMMGEFSYGFSFQALMCLCKRRLEAYLEANKEKDIESFCTNFDVFDYRQSKGSGLSNAVIFPNNDPARANRNAVARKLRIAYKKAFGTQHELRIAANRISDLEKQNRARADEISNLKEKLKAVTVRLNETHTDLIHQEGRSIALAKANWFLVIIAMLAVPLSLVALDPTAISGVWSRILSSITK